MISFSLQPKRKESQTNSKSVEGGTVIENQSQVEQKS